MKFKSIITFLFNGIMNAGTGYTNSTPELHLYNESTEKGKVCLILLLSIFTILILWEKGIKIIRNIEVIVSLDFYIMPLIMMG